MRSEEKMDCKKKKKSLDQYEANIHHVKAVKLGLTTSWEKQDVHIYQHVQLKKLK